MTATRPEDQPDPHPDSPPPDSPGTPERVDPAPDREGSPVEEPGPPDGDEIMRTAKAFRKAGAPTSPLA